MRAGLPIAAGVRNYDGPAHVTSAVPLIALDAATDVHRRCRILIGLFTPGHRRSVFDEAKQHGFTRAATLIDPTSPVAHSAELGEGVYVNAGVVIAGGCRLADWVLVNRSASIGHHSELAEYVSIGPGAVLGGGVRAGRGAMIGTGAVILAGVEIGSNAVIGAGSVVLSAVPANCLVVGNPARIVKTGIKGYNDVAA